MPYRHWFVIVTADHEERRIGPFATRRAADREAKARFGPAEGSGAASVVLFYEHTSPRPGRYP
jgi:hypothetical protein